MRPLGGTRWLYENGGVCDARLIVGLHGIGMDDCGGDTMSLEREMPLRASLSRNGGPIVRHALNPRTSDCSARRGSLVVKYNDEGALSEPRCVLSK
jgi:hypothetical protein